MYIPYLIIPAVLELSCSNQSLKFKAISITVTSKKTDSNSYGRQRSRSDYIKQKCIKKKNEELVINI